MTRSLLLTAAVASALFAHPTPAHGQAEAPSQAKTIGLIGGVDFATLTGNDVTNTTSVAGLMGGVFLGVMVSPWVELEPEVLYSEKGSSFSDTDTTLALDYIEVPILVKVHLQQEGGLYLVAGPAVNFNVGCTASAAGTTGCSTLGLSPNLTFGGVLGLGYSRGHLGFEGRYDFDFSDALALDQFTNLDAKNRVWAILVRVSR
jgi:hypothetical protein